MEYLLFFIILGGIASIIKHPSAFVGIFLMLIYTFGTAIMFALAAQSLNAPEGIIILTAFIGFIASIVFAAYVPDMIKFFKKGALS